MTDQQLKILKSTLYCSDCGSKNVQVRAWVDANTNEFCSDCNDGDTWCSNCDNFVNLVTLPDLWQRLADIPIDSEDCIEQPFLNFPIGTHRQDIWRWFDKRCPNGLGKDQSYLEQ